MRDALAKASGAVEDARATVSISAAVSVAAMIIAAVALIAVVVKR